MDIFRSCTSRSCTGTPRAGESMTDPAVETTSTDPLKSPDPPVRMGLRHQFTSRYALHTREVSHRRLLLSMCAFSAAAESFNTVVTPTFIIGGRDVTGTFCNFFGAVLGGFALKLCELGPKASTLSDAFRGGFVGAFTSFCFMVEESASLQCARSSRALQYFLMSAFFGPMFFDIGQRAGANVLGVLATLKHEDPGDEEPAKVWLDRARYLMTSCVVVAIAVEQQLRGTNAAIELIVGVLFTIAACVVGDVIGVFSQVLFDFETEVNWGTLVGNVFALALLAIAMFSEPHLPDAGWLGSVIHSKYRACFCGMISGYGAFTEDVAGQLSSSHIEIAATNMGMNVLVGVVFMAVFEYASCGISFQG